MSINFLRSLDLANITQEPGAVDNIIYYPLQRIMELAQVEDIPLLCLFFI